MENGKSKTSTKSFILTIFVIVSGYLVKIKF
jgi:hypothetical protein